jgi:hypothetical protein
MAKPALEEIVIIEKEIQAQIAAARRKTATWLEEQRAAIARDSAARRAARRREYEAGLAGADAAARRELEIEVAAAARYAAFLKELPDSKLAAYLRKHLGRILPERRP